MTKIHKQPYRLPPPLIPKELLGMGYTCSSCSRQNQIDWITPQPFPKQPIQHIGGNNHYVPASITQVCPCGHFNHIPFPTKASESTWGLFGDEAEREFQEGELPGVESKAHFFTISLATIHRDSALQFQQKLSDLKQAVRPDRAPSEWQLHMTNVWNLPPNTDGFALADKLEKVRFIRNVASLLQKFRPDLFTINVSSCRVLSENDEWRKLVKTNKQEVFATALITSLHLVRSNNKSLIWNFDHNVPPEKRNGSEGWAEEVFLGLQYSPVFTWLSAGSLVQSPRFHIPGSHYLLEVADALSFLVARDFEQRTKGRLSDFPSSLTGVGHYQAFDENGSLSFRWNNGLPFDKFYPRLLTTKRRSK